MRIDYVYLKIAYQSTYPHQEVSEIWGEVETESEPFTLDEGRAYFSLGGSCQREHQSKW